MSPYAQKSVKTRGENGRKIRLLLLFRELSLDFPCTGALPVIQEKDGFSHTFHCSKEYGIFDSMSLICFSNSAIASELSSEDLSNAIIWYAISFAFSTHSCSYAVFNIYILQS